MHNGVFLLPALILDRWWGEPSRYHPLVGFGRLAERVEARFNVPAALRPGRPVGVLALLLLVLPPVAAARWLEHQPVLGPFLMGLLLYAAIGLRSLGDHARAVTRAFATDGLAAARERVGWIVSRDTAALDAAGVARAGCESVLENGCDAVFGALFWFLVAGAPGAVAYRLVNTLDAMWGYRTPRFQAFGWAAARADDLLNWIPARLTALTYALAGRTRPALAAWRRRPPWKSPNAGVVMAVGAGALELRLGGPASYHGQVQDRPVLGAGAEPVLADLPRAVALVERGALLWAGSALLWAGSALLLGVLPRA
ncbi:MAG: cobalamin biosynthesis protein [Magnetococcales bacterium]|nr:cobalamin biosynthesis protein [Magnetococcales bacterium]